MTADPPTPPTRLPRATRVADYIVMMLAIVLGGGSIILFGWAGRPSLVHMQLSPIDALMWNAFLSLIFFIQHSVMVRRSIRTRMAVVIPLRYDGAFYAITSGFVLALVTLLYQRVEAPPLFVLHGVPRLIAYVIALLSVVLTIWAIRALRTFDPFGTRPIRQHLRNKRDSSSSNTLFRAKAFVVRGPFRWVRHPLYSAVIILLWATPEMSPGRLELAALWTLWILVGALLEERDLVIEFGETYRQYCNQVPMLIPWRGPAPVQLGQ
jgi:protein-S-isoprenylcysteine O-methyltransferase Ste14